MRLKALFQDTPDILDLAIGDGLFSSGALLTEATIGT
jgi:hypothetical protein